MQDERLHGILLSPGDIETITIHPTPWANKLDERLLELLVRILFVHCLMAGNRCRGSTAARTNARPCSGHLLRMSLHLWESFNIKPQFYACFISEKYSPGWKMSNIVYRDREICGTPKKRTHLFVTCPARQHCLGESKPPRPIFETRDAKTQHLHIEQSTINAPKYVLNLHRIWASRICTETM